MNLSMSIPFQTTRRIKFTLVVISFTFVSSDFSVATENRFRLLSAHQIETDAKPERATRAHFEEKPLGALTAGRGDLPLDNLPPKRMVVQSMNQRGTNTDSQMRPSSAVYASGEFCHHPLYYEQPVLERWLTCETPWQPVLSAVHFAGTTVTLPFKIWRRPRCSCVRSGYCHSALATNRMSPRNGCSIQVEGSQVEAYLVSPSEPVGAPATSSPLEIIGPPSRYVGNQ